MKRPYEAPAIDEMGALWEMTGSQTLFIGKQVVQLAAVLSLPVTPPRGHPGPVTPPGQGIKHGTQTGGLSPLVSGNGDLSGVGGRHATGGQHPHHHVTHGAGPQSGTGNATASGGNGLGGALRQIRSGGGGLPFTGFIVTITAGLGAALMSAGAFLRRFSRRATAS